MRSAARRLTGTAAVGPVPGFNVLPNDFTAALSRQWPRRRVLRSEPAAVSADVQSSRTMAATVRVLVTGVATTCADGAPSIPPETLPRGNVRQARYPVRCKRRREFSITHNSQRLREKLRKLDQTGE